MHGNYKSESKSFFFQCKMKEKVSTLNQFLDSLNSTKIY